MRSSRGSPVKDDELDTSCIRAPGSGTKCVCLPLCIRIGTEDCSALRWPFCITPPPLFSVFHGCMLRGMCALSGITGGGYGSTSSLHMLFGYIVSIPIPTLLCRHQPFLDHSLTACTYDPQFSRLFLPPTCCSSNSIYAIFAYLPLRDVGRRSLDEATCSPPCGGQDLAD
jgi:hypothetical protein